jgi:hypothetical protein
MSITAGEPSDLIALDQFNHQVIRVDSAGNIVASYGNIN